MEGTKRDCPSVRRRSKGGYLLVFLVALAAALVAAGSSLTEAKVQKAQKTTSDRLYVENRGCEVMELNPLRTEEYPEITEAVREYYRQQGEEQEQGKQKGERFLFHGVPPYTGITH